MVFFELNFNVKYINNKNKTHGCESIYLNQKKYWERDRHIQLKFQKVLLNCLI